MNASRLPIYFIVATVAIDAMGIGLIMPVMPDLLRDVHGGDLSDAAIWGGVLDRCGSNGDFGCNLSKAKTHFRGVINGAECQKMTCETAALAQP